MPVSSRWSDTTPEAMKVFVELHRKAPNSQKAGAVFAWSETLLRLAEDNVRRCFPHAGEREVFLRMAARHLPKDLMIRAYGWHPDMGTGP